ncbi:MAG: hypothetical protein HC769_04650 [Cyanobacteria bacterium CRU_2_1]|nr:hypothetical protein [Cyanobacteria bacterium RU_5_0]NJR58202.1 hypothetical protein [Cyanobacteria bacterium CRU_2_1]
MPANSSPIQSLLTQFQARFPTASLVTELLTIHQGNYVIRALVQLGGTTLATGMATASDIEQAEDRAKVRALETLGLGTPTTLTSHLSSQSLSYPLPDLLVGDYANSTEIASSSPPSRSALLTDPTVASSLLNIPESPEILAEQPDPSPPFNQSSTFTDFSHYSNSIQSETSETSDLQPMETEMHPPDIDLTTITPSLSLDTAEPEPDLPPLNDYSSPPTTPPTKTNTPSKEKSTKRKTDASEKSGASSAGDDRSGEIARITVEMKRLSWTTEQGRNYLKRTYGKRSRQELSDDELIDFLRYLESQPSPSQSLF